MALVRFRKGVSAASGQASLQQIAKAANAEFSSAPGNNACSLLVSALGVQQPAQIRDYGTVGASPAVLASGLAGGAIVALGFTLVASVRRRRRELALLKALGFTQRQLAAAISWQASVAGVVGVVVGLPLGVAVGRWLWTLFAEEVFAVPRPTVPVGPLILVAVGALALVNVVAALPGLIAARTRIALVLRAE
jgi:ABC-type antimicrobial peptide transport system permease subunit